VKALGDGKKKRPSRCTEPEATIAERRIDEIAENRRTVVIGDKGRRGGGTEKLD